MTLVQDKPKYEVTPISNPKKAGIRVISEMSTSKILWYVTCRHSSGLKTMAIIGLVGYLAYDKFVTVFI